MLYLIGVDHSVQHNGHAFYQGEEFERLRQEFPEFLIQVARLIGAKAIAEECNEEALKKFAAATTFAATVAAELGIQHQFVEPSLAERERLGITGTNNPADFPKRERYWLEKILAIDETPILFVLGADHVGSLTALAEGSGMPVEVAEEYFGRDYFTELDTPR